MVKGRGLRPSPGNISTQVVELAMPSALVICLRFSGSSLQGTVTISASIGPQSACPRPAQAWSSRSQGRNVKPLHLPIAALVDQETIRSSPPTCLQSLPPRRATIQGFCDWNFIHRARLESPARCHPAIRQRDPGVVVWLQGTRSLTCLTINHTASPGGRNDAIQNLGSQAHPLHWLGHH
ncbi:hypothetical protein NPIL_275801 [Nephila pilipes]|uniref:Uncharacterized protein n=1 Tax=Nephila pilipes TaxID=299642 RepID=A0A8X6Q9P3_NEPPI|nr:hypothetical protein NPIL_275801 [Nephila pilipes]